MNNKRIDIHAHVFNLNFLPAAAAVRGYVHANVRGLKLPKFLCKMIAGYFLKRTNNNRFLGFEDSRLDEIDLEKILEEEFTLMEGFTRSTVEGNLEEITPEEETELIEFINAELGEVTLDELDIPESELIKLGLDSTKTVEDFLNIKTQESFAKIDIGFGWGFIIKLLIFRIGRTFYNKKIKPFLSWFFFMTNPYKMIADKIEDYYDEIDLFVHHDMDMDDWYKRWKVGKSRIPYDKGVEVDELNATQEEKLKDQVSRISRLVKNREGRFLSFYAYNPRVGITKLVKAIEGKGYAGVKFYPPSGYKAIDNSNALWNKNNLELFDFCQKEKIPILTHCNYGGMEAFKNAHLKSNVKYWRRILQMDRYKDLILCFGHAGGPKGWFSENNETGNKEFATRYPGMIYGLCTEFENVYCDFGFMPDIFTKYKADRLAIRLLECYENSAKNSKYHFENKIIYGTDIHMLMQHHEFEDYYSEYKKFFSRPELDNYREQFFSQNAVNFLNLKSYIERNTKNNFLSENAIKYLEDFI